MALKLKKQKTVKTAGFANLVSPSHGRVVKTVNNKGAVTMTIQPLSPKSKLK